MYSLDGLLSLFGTSLLFFVLTVASWSAYGFLRRQVRWSGIPIIFRIFHSYCWSPTPATRDSTWRGERCRWMRHPLIFLGLPTYFKFKILFYTFTKTLGQRFDIFSSPSPRFIISINHCCSSNRVPASVTLSGISLIIYYLPPLMCPIVNLWLHCNSCYIPQFTTYLPKSCLPLTSWAHYLLKRLLAIVSLKIPNFYKL